LLNNELRNFKPLGRAKKQTQFKPNSNPIKPITNPIKANTNPIQTQFVEMVKMLEFTLDVSLLAFLSGAWIRSLTIVLIMILADFTTLKGASIVER
jgi:hypothetical protein